MIQVYCGKRLLVKLLAVFVQEGCFGEGSDCGILAVHFQDIDFENG